MVRKIGARAKPLLHINDHLLRQRFEGVDVLKTHTAQWK